MANIVQDMANISDLYAAASLGQIEAIYKAIHQNPRILEDIDAAPFINTPLHNSAFAGHLEFSIEIMRLKPSFGWKLNQQGFSPIHVALQNNHRNLVRRLVEINKDLVRVKGREGVTPLHFVCQSGDDEENITLLIDLLKACPDSIKEVNVRNESALHIALINGNFSVFRKLVHWLANNVNKDASSLERSTLNWKDSAGNTILHVAALNNNQQAVDLLMSTMVNINVRNLNNETPLDLAQAHPHPHPLSQFERPFFNYYRVIAKSFSFHGLMKTLKRFQSQLNEENRNAYLVVVTLVVTAVYQAVLSPPGGLTQGGSDNNNAQNTTNTNNLLNSTTIAAGKSVMPLKYFSVISVLNIYIFIIGIITILCMIPNSPRLFFIYTIFSVVIFIASYFVSLSAISPSKQFRIY
ncbi:hypothetical protein PIB30_049725 [Stylosanthes scabra]|uniref:PGG domain-containing protein n=1 Tax=Stylosanthes scabra TaxID=79078 RepID=A0ABU6SI45_9FABA|nr:hypothetical protein [Stylosanthes scabra]